MQPTKLRFTDEQSQQLGEYLDQFVAAGPLEALPEELFKQVQVLVARKIWEINPDIARAIQAVADENQPPALLIENVPIDENLPDTPEPRELGTKSLPPLRSHYFHAGVNLIRYGNIVSLSQIGLNNIVSDRQYVEHETLFRGTPIHRDIYTDNSGDIGLHTQRENIDAKTQIFSIKDVPTELCEKLQTIYYKGEKTPLIHKTKEGLRFHKRFIHEPDMHDPNVLNEPEMLETDKPVVEEFFDWMKNQNEENTIALKEKDFLFIDQSRTFHRVLPYYIIQQREKGRWLTHMRAQVLDGSKYALTKEEKKGLGDLPDNLDERRQVLATFYPMPGDINEGQVLEDISSHASKKRQL